LGYNEFMKVKIKKILKEFTEKENFDVFASEKQEFGDYSTNLLFILAKKRKKSPQEIGSDLKQEILKKYGDIFEKIEVHPSGFLNFWVKRKVYIKQLSIINKQLAFKSSKPQASSSKIMIEFISANPTGVLTVGHGRGAFLGDSLKRILQFLGYNVTGEYYINNAKQSSQIKELGKTGMGEGKTYLNDFLRVKIKNQESKIKNTIKKLKNKSKSEIYGEIGYLLAKEIHRENKRFIQKELNIKFDNWFEEEELYKKGKIEKLLGILKKKKLIYEKEGALWFKTRKYGDDKDRVLIRKSGEPTYFLSDLAYHMDKFKQRKFEKVINIWGADHYGYKDRLIAGLRALGIKESRIEIIITQLLTLKRGKKKVRVSKRKGDYLSLKEVVSEIGLDATRFFFLLYSPHTHMDFDLELAKKKSLDNPLYYLQYALVRGESIIKKAQSKNPNIIRIQRTIRTINIRYQKAKINSLVGGEKFNLLNTEEDLRLIKKLVGFEDKIKEAGDKLSPQILVHYALDLAKIFQHFYEKEKVIVEDKKLSRARIWLIVVFLNIMYKLFDVLGLKKIKKM